MMMSEYDERPWLVAPLVLSGERPPTCQPPSQTAQTMLPQIMSLMQMLVVDSSHRIIDRAVL